MPLFWPCVSPSAFTRPDFKGRPDQRAWSWSWHCERIALQADVRACAVTASQVQRSALRTDAASIAAAIQRQTDQQELQCSLLALAAKAGLVLLGAVSLIRLSVAYQERMDRHSEIAAVVSIESAKLETLQQQFDRLFSIGGEKRLISEQDQWIAPNRLRVIWR